LSDEFKKLIFLCIVLILVLCGIIFLHKFGSVSFLTKYFKSDECSFIPYKNGVRICLGKDAGFKAAYGEASEYCKKLEMRLPTREEAWYVWISSENCQRTYASGSYIAKNKYRFMNPELEKVQAIEIKNYCNTIPSIKFSQSLQYSGGYFWLGDLAGGKRHYAINYSNGSIKVFKDKTKTLGVRCIK